jgi:hypothetical protein
MGRMRGTGETFAVRRIGGAGRSQDIGNTVTVLVLPANAKTVNGERPQAGPSRDCNN